jgi:maleylacetoacetate isomerase
MAWGKKWIEKGMQALEEVLKTSSGKYCVGDEVTLADACLVPQVFNCARFSVSLEPYPLVKAISDALFELPEFKAAHPTNQPDAEL